MGSITDLEEPISLRQRRQKTSVNDSDLSKPDNDLASEMEEDHRSNSDSNLQMAGSASRFIGDDEASTSGM